MRVDALVDVVLSRPHLQLAHGQVELSDEAVTAALVVVVALHFQVSVQVAVAQRPDRHRKLGPHRVQVVAYVLRAVDHREGARLRRAGELEEGVGGAEQVFTVELLAYGGDKD